MSEYVKQAKDFLASCNATMKMMYLGKEMNDNWNETRERDTYMVNIVTPMSNMQIKFWDSINNTIDNANKTSIGRSRKYPTEYDILSCLQKYDVGDIEDFIWEFGYEIKKKGDLKRIMNTYDAVVKEYNDIRRCFTEEQIEAMREIQ